MFFDRYECQDMIEYREIFLNEMKSLLPYFMEFFKDDTMIPKEYSDDYTVERPDQRPIIMITYDKSTFSTNDRCRKVWTLNGQNILRLKEKGKGIMVSNFLLLWLKLKLLSLSPQQQDDLASSEIPLKVFTYFEYRKTEERYCTEEYLLDQIMNKALLIRETLYPGYKLLFLFDNATNYSIYILDILQVVYMNKRPGDQQPFLRPGSFMGSN